MKLSTLCFSLLLIFLSLLPHSVFATLVTRLNGQAVYDTDINVTWLANANLAATNTFGVSDIDSQGYMNWYKAQSWIEAMNQANYLGFNDWRLPNTSDECSVTTFICEKNEMSHLRNNEIISSYSPHIDFITATKVGAFTNIQDDITAPRNHAYLPSYWTNTSVSTNQSLAYDYVIYNDHQHAYLKIAHWSHVWAVRTGDVAAVPIPTPVGLLMSGIVLLGLATKKRVSKN